VGETKGFFPSVEPIVHAGDPIGRNAACPCGSGKKFKRCCLQKAVSRGHYVGTRKPKPNGKKL
jgi:hypothetical protein